MMRGVVEWNRWRPSVFLTWQTHLWWQHLPILTTHTQTCTHTHTVIFICSKSSFLLHQDVWDVQTMSQKHSHNRKHALANRAGEKKLIPGSLWQLISLPVYFPAIQLIPRVDFLVNSKASKIAQSMKKKESTSLPLLQIQFAVYIQMTHSEL